ncbi:MAG: thiamine pyrophosphate-dependent enzyme, partial [Nocardioidaceae bacterium]
PEPLVPGERTRSDQRAPVTPPAWVRPEPTRLELGPRTVVVAGDDAGPPARMLAETADWPLLAEPSSGSRTGTHAIRTYRLLLEDLGLGERVERVVVYGHPTLSRPVTGLIGRDDVELVVVPGPGGATDLTGRGRVENALTVDGKDDPGWLEEWRARDALTARALDALLASKGELLPHQVARTVAEALPRDGLLYVGASNPIRDLDLMVPRYEVGGRRFVLANRGLSGIDGTLSSAIGAVLGRPRTSRAFALVGDVTFLHDSNALILGPDEPRPDLTIVVVNDDGGSIFASLEQGDPSYAVSFERLFGTPHHVDIAALCAATRTPHWPVSSIEELAHALASPAGGIEVVEAVVGRDGRRALDAELRGLGASSGAASPWSHGETEPT